MEKKSHQQSTTTKQRRGNTFLGSLYPSPMSKSRNKLHPPSSTKRDVRKMTIPAADSVGRETLVDRLKLIQDSKLVTTVTVDDIVNRSHNENLLRLVKKLIVGEDRLWKHFCFDCRLDHCDYFPIWQERKNAMMKDYERTPLIWDNDKTTDALVWRVSIKIREGTRRDQVLGLLRAIREDPTVSKLKFGGALKECEIETEIPVKLEELFTGEYLSQTIQTQISCAWLQEKHAWRAILDECISCLEVDTTLRESILPDDSNCPGSYDMSPNKIRESTGLSLKRRGGVMSRAA